MGWRELPKEVSLKPLPPGFDYIYYRSLEDLDKAFTAEFGIDWHRTAWARFWLGSGDWSELNGIKSGTRPDIDELILTLYNQGCKTDRAIKNHLRNELGLSVDDRRVQSALKNIRGPRRKVRQ